MKLLKAVMVFVAIAITATLQPTTAVAIEAIDTGSTPGVLPQPLSEKPLYAEREVVIKYKPNQSPTQLQSAMNSQSNKSIFSRTIDKITSNNSVVSSQKTLQEMQQALAFLRWSDWYPVDFNQPEGYRTINYWDSAQRPNQSIHGLASLNVPNNLDSLPAIYHNNPVDYFFLYQCRNRIGTGNDPYCYDQTYYREIISQGSAVDVSQKTTLEHWARSAYNTWEVYYNPQIIGFDNCDGSKIKQMPINLQSDDNKKPLVLKLPADQNTFYISEPICAFVFNQYNQDKNSVIDTRYVPIIPPPAFETGNWIAITINREKFQDDHDYEIIHAENIYLTDNPSAADRFSQQYCQQIDTADMLRCEGNGTNRVGLRYNLNRREYKTFAFEEYWMRKTQNSGQYGNIIDRYGFGAFRWWLQNSESPNDFDQVRNDGSFDSENDSKNQIHELQQCVLDQWYNILSCQSISGTPTPTPTKQPNCNVDIDCSGAVDANDYRSWSSAVANQKVDKADISNNSIIDITDLIHIIQTWL